MNILRPSNIRKKGDTRNAQRRIAIVIGGVFFLSVVTGAIFFVRQSDFFKVQSIVLLGVSDPYGRQVVKNLEAFSKQRSSLFRFFGADNMVAWGGGEKEFLDANPDIKELRIRKEYGTHAIIVEIIAREKFGAWCRQKSDLGQSREEHIPAIDDSSIECFWFDIDGVLFAKAPIVRSELFNRVFDLTNRSLVLRDKIMPDHLFKNLTRVFTLLEIAQINTKTVVLFDLALEEVVADSVSDPRTIFSLRFDPSFSLSAIDALKKTGEWKKIQYANFTVENKVSYR